MIVLDANILIRAVLGRRVRHLLETYSAQGVRSYAPDVAYTDAEEYLPALLMDLVYCVMQIDDFVWTPNEDFDPCQGLSPA